MNILDPDSILEFTSRRQETIGSAMRKVSNGFCPRADLTPAELGVVFENNEHASIIKINSAGLHGGRHFSIHDLLGHSVSRMTYVVTDHESFAKYISAQLENDFLKKNQDAGSNIRASFTSFMHENKLHWSRCCGNHSTTQKRAIREKLRRLSHRTGKSHTQILTELLDSALTNETR